MEAPVKKGFWGKIFEDNRQFDSSMTIFFVFACFLISITAIVGAFFMNKTIPKEFYDLVNVFENFILMILSYFFTRATRTPTHRDEDMGNSTGGQK